MTRRPSLRDTLDQPAERDPKARGKAPGKARTAAAGDKTAAKGRSPTRKEPQAAGDPGAPATPQARQPAAPEHAGDRTPRGDRSMNDSQSTGPGPTEEVTPVAEIQVIPRPSSEARRIIRRYATWAAGAGFLPIPVVDTIGMTSAVVKMMTELDRLHGWKTDPGFIRSAALVLLGVLTPKILVASAGKAVPALHAGSMVALAAFAWAATWAVGQVYASHLASGAAPKTLDLDFAKEAVVQAFENQAG